MDYDSPGAYKKNKLIQVSVYNRFQWACDSCGKYPNPIILTLRGGYVQNQLCEECNSKKLEEDV
jgi:hypothetical protein